MLWKVQKSRRWCWCTLLESIILDLGERCAQTNFLKLMSGEVLDAVEVSLALCRFPGIGENYCATEAWSWRSPPDGRSQTLEQSCTQQEPAEIAYWKQEEKLFSCNVSQGPSSAKVNLYQQTKKNHLQSPSPFSYSQQWRMNL